MLRASRRNMQREILGEGGSNELVVVGVLPNDERKMLDANVWEVLENKGGGMYLKISSSKILSLPHFKLREITEDCTFVKRYTISKMELVEVK